MADSTITSANASYILTIASLYPSGVTLESFSTDRAFLTDAVDMAEVMMGVDGKMTGGYVPNPVKQTVSLMADSASRKYFNALIAAERTQREKYWLSGVITLPSTGETYTLTRGLLTSGKIIPDAQKVLQPIDYVITWERIDWAPLS